MNTTRFELVIFDCDGVLVFGYAQHSDGAALALNGAKIVFNNMQQLPEML